MEYGTPRDCEVKGTDLLKPYYSSPHTLCFLNGSVCAIAFTAACLFLIWSAPRVFAAEEYPSHQEIAHQLAQLDKRLAVNEEYRVELLKADIRNRLLIVEQAQITAARDRDLQLKMNWGIMFGVFLPYFGRAINFYSRASRRRRRRQGVADRAADDAEDEETLREDAE